jgi:hypothetical protein
MKRTTDSLANIKHNIKKHERHQKVPFVFKEKTTPKVYTRPLCPECEKSCSLHGEFVNHKNTMFGVQFLWNSREGFYFPFNQIFNGEIKEYLFYCGDCQAIIDDIYFHHLEWRVYPGDIWKMEGFL